MEDLAKEMLRSNRDAQRNHVQVSTLFLLCYVYCSWALGLNSNIEDYATLISYTRNNVFILLILFSSWWMVKLVCGKTMQCILWRWNRNLVT